VHPYREVLFTAHSRIPKRSSVAIAVQGLLLKRAQPNSTYRFSGHNSFVWEGALRPGPLSGLYRVRVEYKFGRHPRTRVIDPPLQRHGNDAIPHMYGQKSLCLYRPSKNEWDSTMSLADTILPWASLWLFYYEIWLATGEWVGGGEHPGEKESDPSDVPVNGSDMGSNERHR
jgi:hypothetical protein